MTKEELKKEYFKIDMYLLQLAEKHNITKRQLIKNPPDELKTRMRFYLECQLDLLNQMKEYKLNELRKKDVVDIRELRDPMF
jgi:hypothetical protein